MNAERLSKIEEICHAVLATAPKARSAFLTKLCGGDDNLRSEVESLLSFADVSSTLIDKKPLDVAAEMFFEKKRTKIVGTKIGHYRILSKIGEGGMGEVFLAEDTRLDRRVAIKILPREFAKDTERMRRFVREAKSASALNHPNIITIYEISKIKNTHFIATEYIAGETLHTYLKNQSVNLKTVLEIAIQTASALDVAHNAGIVHRDIKPENVMIRPDSLVKILDFGIAKTISDLGFGNADLKTPDAESETAINSTKNPQSAIPNPQSTGLGMIIGTANYMSPEQARGLRVDARSDIFSFGILFYEMLAGKRAFAGENARETIGAILHKEPIPLNQIIPDIPPEIERIINKMLTKDRDERYQTANDLLTDLRELKQNLEFAVKLERSGSPDTPGKTVRTDTLQTGNTSDIHATSSAEYIVNNIKHYKIGAIAALTLLVLASTAVFFYFKSQPVLTDKDTVLIADFENLTDDSVFNGTIKLGLAVQLGQSPFLRIFPEADVKETLRLMERGADERITPEIAREICRRQGVKAFITGSIAPFGDHYVVTLKVIKAENGEAMINVQNEAETKEQVLTVLGKTATNLREKLGESLASIKKFDVPTEQATTSSLEALRAYSMAMEFYAKGGNKDEAVIALFQLAIKLDPNFALAFRDLARHQFNIGRRTEAVASITKAFELRERTSENEKLSIEVLYYNFAADDLVKAAETAELWKRTFPRFWQPYHVLADIYFGLGQYEKAVENGREAVRLNPNFAAAYTNPAGALVQLCRYTEAKELYRQAMANKLDHVAYHLFLFWIGYFEHDTAEIHKQLDWMRTHNYEHFALQHESQLASLEGRWTQSLEFSRRAGAEAEKYGEKELPAALAAWDAHTGALFGDCKTAKQRAGEVLSMTENNIFLADAAFALAMCGEERQALKIADDLAARFPKDAVLRELRLPTVRAAVELQRGRPDQAIELLRSTGHDEVNFLNFAPFVHGFALLRKGANAEAAIQFQSIHECPMTAEWTPSIPLSYLWEARALALAGDNARSRQAYDEFFALWKDADADLPILIEAKREYKRLLTR